VKRPAWPILVLAALAARSSSSAYDSSGGAGIAKLLARVEFASGGSPEFDPPLFEWTPLKRREVSDALAVLLTQMPLDVADLPEIERLSVSNARCSVPADADSLQEDDEFTKGAPETRKNHYLYHCGADTATYYPMDKSVAISGTLYALSRGPAAEGRKVLARALLHELTHAWEKDAVARPFYALGFERRDQTWFRVLGGYERIYETAEDIAVRADETRRLADLRKAIEDSEEAIYLTLGLPARFGGSTGRVDPLSEPGENRVDTYTMRSRHEYLAVLSELLWVDRPLALSQFSPEEIAWVERHVFKMRPVVAFDAGTTRP
jgi:hypothetical protein